MKINTVLLKPRITEKALALAQKDIYSFEVALAATKPQVKNAIETLFSVKDADIKMVTKKGKVRRVGKRMKTKQLPNSKIAVISLKSGKITIFPQP